MSDTDETRNETMREKLFYLLAITTAALLSVGVMLLFSNISQHKQEALTPYNILKPVSEDVTDPAEWGINWPKQYDSYKLTAESTSTVYGGHSGSESLPPEKIDRDPWLKRIFLGYAFSLDYRDRRGHAYMLNDQEASKRLTKPQTGSCLHCHGSVMPLYRKLGEGDVFKGLDATYKMSYQDAHKALQDTGGAHPVACVDCHVPNTMQLRVTRPGFIRGIQSLAASDVPVPHLPSIERWRATNRATPYDPNRDATRTEMRSYVCGQCHVEYYCSTKMPLTFPWGKGLKAEQIEDFWNSTKVDDGHRFYDYKHAETGAEVLKAQHPEFEMWSQGIHARSGVSCADCHMPYTRDGATKISDHWVRSPLLNINKACQSCHKFAEAELQARVSAIQDRNHELLERAGAAIVGQLDAMKLAKEAQVSEEKLKDALELQRRAQWRLDFVAAENSMGFHAPQETARILGESIDYSRQGEIAAMKALSEQKAAAPASAQH